MREFVCWLVVVSFICVAFYNGMMYERRITKSRERELRDECKALRSLYETQDAKVRELNRQQRLVQFFNSGVPNWATLKRSDRQETRYE